MLSQTGISEAGICELPSEVFVPPVPPAPPAPAFFPSGGIYIPDFRKEEEERRKRKKRDRDRDDDEAALVLLLWEMQ